jgi:hypothetical protein
VGEQGLIVNPTKCKVVVFGGKGAWPRHKVWTLPAAGGRRTPMVTAPKFKYLGV